MMQGFSQKILFMIFLVLMETSSMIQAATVQDVNIKDNLNQLINKHQGYDENKKTINKFDIFIRNTTIVDVVNKRVLTNKDITIVDGKISNIQDSVPSQDILNSANEIIDGSNYIALPGFVNTHTHLWQHISKSLVPKEPLQTWTRIYRPIHYLTHEELSDVVLAASCEALLSGITTVSDYASLSFNDYGFEINAKSIAQAGLNGVLVWNNPSIYLHDQIKLKEIERLKVKYKNNFDIWMGFGPLSFYSIPAVYSGILIAKQLNMQTTEHTMENIEEQRNFRDTTNKYLDKYATLQPNDRAFLQNLVGLSSPSNVDAYEQLLRTAEQILQFDIILQNDTSYKKLTEVEKHTLTMLKRMYDRRISPLILLDYFQILNNHLAIHSVWLQNQDIDILKKNGMPISHNPESNMYLTSGMAPIETYLKENILVTIGTDGAASNDGINFFSAMREMWNIYKIKLMNTEISKKFDEWNIIQAATINGAKALKLNKKIGSIDINKQADLSLIATNELGVSPLRPDTIIALLIYSANARNVKYVISNGIIRVENGALKHHSESKLATRLSEIAKNVDSRIIDGKTWAGIYTLTEEELAPSYWYRYRSIRPKDVVKINIRCEKHIYICVATSGAVFGGGTATVVDRVVQKRFPEEILPKAFSKRIFLPRNTLLFISKDSNDLFYEIHLDDLIIFTSSSSSSHQLLVLATATQGELSNICLDTTI